MLYDVNVKKQPVAEVLERARHWVMLALTAPATLILHCSNAAPDFKHTFSNPRSFPKEIFQHEWLIKGQPSNYFKLLREEDKQECGAFYVRPGSRVSTLSLHRHLHY